MISFENDSIGNVCSCEQFTIDFILERKKYLSEIKDCELLLPEFSNRFDNIDTEFRYENYRLNFSDVPSDWFFARQKVAWHFTVKYPPFEESRFWYLNFEEAKEIQIHFMQFDPYESGQPFEIISPVYSE